MIMQTKVKCNSPSDVTEVRTFLSELRNLNQLFFLEEAQIFVHILGIIGSF